MSQLVLWDIDKTLVDVGDLGRQWYAEVFRRVFDTSLESTPVFSGRTERAIAQEFLRLHGFEVTEARVQAMFDALIEIADEQAHRLSIAGTALPGAREALTALAARDGLVQSLVTGNLPSVARRKITAFDLGEHLSFDFGGFGDASALRADLVATAVKSYTEVHGAPTSVIVIGDAPGDIECARANGAMAVGVATGNYSRAELLELGADVVLGDLRDTTAVLALLDS